MIPKNLKISDSSAAKAEVTISDTITRYEAEEAFKNAARDEAIRIAEDEYDSTHGSSLESVYNTQAEAFKKIRRELPANLFDGVNVCECLELPFDLDDDDDSGLTEEEAREVGEQWAFDTVGEDLDWIKELAEDDLVYHFEGSDQTITRDEIRTAVDTFVDYLIDRANAGKEAALFLFEDGYSDIKDPAHPFTDRHIRTSSNEVGEIEDYDDEVLNEWAEHFDREDVVNELAGQLEIGKPRND